MKISFKIIVLVFLFNISTTNAQVGLHCDQLTIISNPSVDFKNTLFEYSFSILKSKNDSSQNLNDFAFQNQRFQAFPKIYNYHNLAFFCKVEVKLEEAVRFPVKFRLGDVNYVDQLEGK